MEAVARKDTRKVATILPDSFGLAEHRRRDFVADVKPSVTVDEVLDPAFWSHVAEHMQPLDKIEVRWEDGSKIVHLRVLWRERAMAKVRLISKEDLGDIGADEIQQSSRYRVQWRGPTVKHCVVRVSDDAVMQQRFESRALALAWITENDK